MDFIDDYRAAYFARDVALAVGAMWSSHILFHNILMAISATYRALPETLYPHKKSHPRIPLVGSCVHINACQDLVEIGLGYFFFLGNLESGGQSVK
eukprot:1335646-Amorphochlora_amoeboformis.AAC.2